MQNFQTIQRMKSKNKIKKHKMKKNFGFIYMKNKYKNFVILMIFRRNIHG